MENGYSVEMQVLSSLHVLGYGSFQTVASTNTFAQISQSSVSRFLDKFLNAISLISERFISFPTSEDELMQNRREFHLNTGFPNCVGAVDCTHINIVRPVEDDYFVFINRKNRFSINVQMVCDYNLKIIDVVARWPGSNHDSFIWSSCGLREIFSEELIPAKNFLLGDSGYPLEPWLLTPYIEESNQRQRTFNQVHSKARNAIERCFGVLKSRFRCLHDTGGILQYTPEKVCKIIIACAVLHNICLKYDVTDTDACSDDFDGDSDIEDMPLVHGSTSVNLREKGASFREEISLRL